MSDDALYKYLCCTGPSVPDSGQIEKSRPSCALSPAKKHAGKRCRCRLQAGYQASRQVTVLRVCAGCVPGLGSGLAMVPAAVGLSDGQVKHGLLQVSLLTGREQQGLRLEHSGGLHRGTVRACSCRCCCSLDLPRGLLASLARLSDCPRAQELSTAGCRRAKPPHFEAAPRLKCTEWGNTAALPIMSRKLSDYRRQNLNPILTEFPGYRSLRSRWWRPRGSRTAVLIAQLLLAALG